MANPWTWLIFLTTIIGLILLATACGSAPAGQPLEPVTVQLKWVHQAQFAGFYVAREKGYYADEKLAVTLLEGGPKIDVTDQVAAGAADFGVDAPENRLVHRGTLSKVAGKKVNDEKEQRLEVLFFQHCQPVL